MIGALRVKCSIPILKIGRNKGEIMEHNLGKLTYEEKDQVLNFLLNRMDIEIRGKLMARLPIAYATMYPYAKSATLNKVMDALTEIN
jgi:hypothetical protein